MKYRHKEDCFIDREHNPGAARLVDCDGYVVFIVSAFEWSDDQIWKALELMNKAYAQGVLVGQTQKVNEIKRVLFID
jgi:hypothetical protein